MCVCFVSVSIAEADKLFSIIVINCNGFYSPSCFLSGNSEGVFGLRVKLPPAHLFTTHGGGFTVSL